MSYIRSRYRPSDIIGKRYLVHETLMGGMGEVYLCLDEKTGYPIALKTLQQRYLASYAARNRFETEVASWIALEDHPNIVHCHHLYNLDNQPFLFLEWVPGVQGYGADLRSWLWSGAADLRTTLDFTIDICRGLIHAQDKQPGIVHRDLKPENILIDHARTAKITDFGLARVMGSVDIEMPEQPNLPYQRQNLTAVGDIVGTPAYMAPEQWRGEAVDVRTDIYAIGIILYELIAGQRPFVATSIKKLRELHLKASPPRLSKSHQKGLLNILRRRVKSVPGVPPEILGHIDDIVVACLAKSKQERPQTPTQLLAQLSEVYWKSFASSPKALRKGNEYTAGEYHNRGLTYVQVKRYQEAINDFNRALELTPDEPELYSMRAAAYSEWGKNEAALRDHDRAIALNPTRSTFLVNRSYTLGELGQLEAALDDLHHALELDPANAQAVYNRAGISQELGRHREAFVDYERVIEINPMFVKAYYDRGALHSRLQRYREAIADYTRAIELDPGLMEAYVNRGNAYMAQQQYRRALADYQMAIQIDPYVATTYNSLGCVYDELDEHKKAIECFTHALGLNPQYLEAYVNRGGTYNHLDRYEETLADSLRAIELDAGCAAAYLHAGSALANQGRLREALPYFERASQLGDQQANEYALQVVRILQR